MIYLLYVVHVLVCLFLILVVLLQQGKGADLSVFGGGATQAAFGARGAATVLHKLTVWAFVAFIVTTLSIAYFQGRASGGSVMSDVAREQLTREVTAAESGEGVLPESRDAEGGGEGQGAETPAAPGDADPGS